MALEEINHDTSSKIADAATTGLKWGLGTLLAVAAVGALVGSGGTALVLTSIVGYKASEIALTTLAWGAIAGAAAGVSMGTIPTLVGTALGVLKGTAQTSREKEAYAARVAGHQNSRQAEQAMAFQAGQQSVVSAIQQQMMAQGAVPVQEPNAAIGGLVASADQTNAKVTADCETNCKSHVEAITKERAMAAAGGLQVG